jgi:U4/U6 small nuclear ribonucleoprotein PRP31
MIDHFTSHPSDTSEDAGPIEENPEYSLIVQANNLSVEIDNELLLVHKVSSAKYVLQLGLEVTHRTRLSQFIRDHYNPRFPELEQVISDPWEYIIAVQSIGNAPVSLHEFHLTLSTSLTRLFPTLRTSRNLQPQSSASILWVSA